MQKVTLFFLTIFLMVSCTISKKDKLIGTWSTVSMEKSTGSTDSAKVQYYIEFTDDGIYYLNQSVDGNWYFYKGYNMDSIHYETINFISKDNFEIIFPDSAQKNLGISKNPIYHRVERNIKPNEIMLDLYNKYFPLGTTLDVDTLGDKSLFYHCYLTGTRKKSISAAENEVKFFFDKRMKSLPKEEELNKYDPMYGKIMNKYLWEDMQTKISLESYFNFKNTKDKYKFNDNDQLEVKIWLDIK
jgi:hypothetical protein